MAFSAQLDELTALFLLALVLTLRFVVVWLRLAWNERQAVMAREYTHVRVQKATRDALAALGNAWRDAQASYRPAPDLDMADGPPSADAVIGELIRLYYDHKRRSAESSKKKAREALGPDVLPPRPATGDNPPERS